MNPNELLGVNEAAAFFTLKPATLNKWRTTGGGPDFVKLGASVRYRRIDLERFLRAKTFASTAELRP